jgi:serine/threonine-protein kinase
VADFGIALAVSSAGGSRLTETGLSLGTPHYMSPEQATGERDAGPQGDVYSLGAVLYEVLAGEPPHTGPTAQAVLAKILTEKAPRVSLKRETVPPHVEAAVLKALERLPADRFRSAAELSAALADPAFRHGSVPAAEAEGRTGSLARRWWTGWAAAAVLGITAVGLALQPRASAPETETTVTSFVVPFAEGETTERVGSWGPALALSPSGTKLAYVARRGSGTENTLYLKHVDEFEAQPVAGAEGAWSPFFSPDEAWIGYFAENRLMKVPVAGGTPVVVAEISFGGANLGGATWLRDNTIIYSDQFRPGLWRVSAEGGSPELIEQTVEAAPDRNLLEVWPHVLPDGEHVLFTLGTGAGAYEGLAVISLETGIAKRITEAGGSATYSPSGHLVYALAGDLLAHPFDLDRLETTGPPVAVIKGVMMGGEGTGHFAVSETGDIAYVPGRLVGPARTVEWVTAEGERESLPLQPGGYYTPRASPLGGQIGFFVEGAVPSVWVFDMDRGTSRRVSDFAWYPHWSEDGRHLVYTSHRNQSLIRQIADGSAAQETLVEGPLARYAQSWTGEGKLVFSELDNAETHGDFWTIDPETDEDPEPLLRTPSNELMPTVSPNGRWLAYVTDDSGKQEVVLRPLPGLGSITPVSTNGGTGPVWSPDGSELYYRDQSGDTVQAVSVSEEPTLRLGRPRVLFTGNYIPDYPFGRSYDVSRQDGRFLMVTGTPPLEGWDQIRVVRGWASTLEDQAGAGTER